MKKQSTDYLCANSLNTYHLILVFLVSLTCLFVPKSVFSQEISPITDTLAIDTLKVHSVKKAVIFSAILPGLGQIYTHRAMPKGKKKAIWKVPLIYAGLGATAYFALKNNSEQRNLKTEYRNRQNNIFTGEYPNLDNQGILTLYDQKVRRRDLFYIGLGFVYLLQIADAAVEAHFVSFDVSDDLSMKIYPTLLPTQKIGIGLTFNFR